MYLINVLVGIYINGHFIREKSLLIKLIILLCARLGLKISLQ